MIELIKPANAAALAIALMEWAYRHSFSHNSPIQILILTRNFFEILRVKVSYRLV